MLPIVLSCPLSDRVLRCKPKDLIVFAALALNRGRSHEAGRQTEVRPGPLMLLAGFERPDDGRIMLDGREVTDVAPHRRGLGMVFQNYALFPHMTVAENVEFALKQRGVNGSERSRRVEAALDLVRLPGHTGRYAQQLSGGQQQRVAIGRALVFDPPVLLMDERLSALDKQLREEMQFEIKRLHDRLRITFVYVTHDQREALIMSDRVVVMDKGRVMQVGTPTGLYDRPSNRFQNLLNGVADQLSRRHRWNACHFNYRPASYNREQD